jgi:hypothetical protein
LSRDNERRRFVLTVGADGEESHFPCSYGEWAKGRGNIGLLTNQPVAGSVAWPELDTCAVKICAYETPYVFSIKMQFDEDQVTLEGESNVAFGPSQWPVLEGAAE